MPKLIRHALPDFHERMFYVSGTHAMTTGIAAILRELGVPRSQIRTDYFPGF